MQDEHSFPNTYRDAMARFAGHVQIVTTAEGNAVRGVTATACCSVSDAPPTILACVNHHNERNHIFTTSGNFAVNTLSARHRPLADAFSGLGRLATAERFALAEWKTGQSGAPVLTDALASFDCRLIEAKRVASHWILIGEVLDVKSGPFDEALVYYERGYRTL